MRRLRPLSSILIVLALGGCLSTETEIVLRENGSGQITVRYTVDEVAYDTGSFGNDEAGRVVPITERDFREAESVVEGLTLRRYRSRRVDGRVEVTAVLDFTELGALSAFLGPETVAIQLSESGGRWTQRIAGARRVDDGDRALADSLSEYTVSLQLQPPSPVRSTNLGDITANGSEARMEIGLDEIILTDEEIVWTVEW